jgi:DnaJ domain
MDGRRARIVLGVGDDAGPAEIRRAFRARALGTHPDHGGDSHAFAEIVDAIDALRRVPAPIVARVPVTRPAGGPRFDAYDAPRRPTPRRSFADALQVATARLT